MDRGPSPGPTASQFEILRLVSRLTRISGGQAVRGIVVMTIVAVIATIGYSAELAEWRRSVAGAAVAEPFAALSFVSTTVLTIALLYATLRYVRLTASMLAEVSEQRRSAIEPSLTVRVDQYFRRADAESIWEWQTSILIRNIGLARAEDVQLRTDWYDSDRLLAYASADIPDQPATLLGGADKSHHMGLTAEDLKRLPHLKAVGLPTFTIRLTFLDAFMRLYSITQDYVVSKTSEKRPPTCTLLSEFRSSPSGYVYRERTKQEIIDSLQRAISVVHDGHVITAVVIEGEDLNENAADETTA